MARNTEFNEPQKDFLKDFLTTTKTGVNKKRISPAYLLYMISKFPDSNKQDIYTKINRVLLRDMLPKKKRLYIDSLIKNFEV